VELLGEFSEKRNVLFGLYDPDLQGVTTQRRFLRVPIEGCFCILHQRTKTNAWGIVYKNRLFISALLKVPLDKNTMGLDVDMIDRINPFSEAYAIMAKTMSESRLRELAAIIAAKKVISDLGI